MKAGRTSPPPTAWHGVTDKLATSSAQSVAPVFVATQLVLSPSCVLPVLSLQPTPLSGSSSKYIVSVGMAC